MLLSDSELNQLEMLKKKSPSERFLMMTRLIGGQFKVMKAGIRFKKPAISEEELESCMKIRMREIYSWKH